MTPRSLLPLLATLLAASPALAGDAPDFLGGGAKFVTDPAYCAREEMDDALQLSTRGLFGYEFGCTFLDFLPVEDDSGTAYQHVALAACGDDSGISRPDLIMLTPSGDDSVRVTSQNDYVAQLARNDDGASGIKWIVDLELTRCR